MYRAIKDIGEYRIGDEVPESKALVWLEMFATPHVEEFVEAKDKKEVKEDLSEEKSSLSNILEDYLGRNQSVVKKNILEDNLNKSQLITLQDLEKKDKQRPLVLKIIKRKLREFK